MIIVPGIASPAATWSITAQGLAEGFDVHILDVRGRGLSESGPHLDYGVDACAADLTAFVMAVGVHIGCSARTRWWHRSAKPQPACVVGDGGNPVDNAPSDR